MISKSSSIMISSLQTEDIREDAADDAVYLEPDAEAISQSESESSDYCLGCLYPTIWDIISTDFKRW